MGADVVTAVAIETVTHARRFAIVFVRPDDFHQPAEPAEEWRRNIAKVNQNVVVYQRVWNVVNNDRRYGGEPVSTSTMGHKASCWQGPQQFGEMLGGGRVRRKKHHAHAARKRLAGQHAGRPQLVIGFGV